MTSFFTSEEASILLRLLVAHFLTDFFWQPGKWIEGKNNRIWRSSYLWYHGLLTGAVAWIFLFDLQYWRAILIIILSHTLIDGIKAMVSARLRYNPALSNEQKNRSTLRLFIVDQLCHLAVLVILWLLIIDGSAKMIAFLKTALPDYRFLIRILGYLLILEPVGYLIGFVTRRWSDELNMQDSLKDAGKWIGMLERVLILTFVYTGQFGAIGFLIAAKSLLRVIDKPDKLNTDPGFIQPFSSRKHTEYVLIGTFLSFAISLAAGLLINSLLQINFP